MKLLKNSVVIGIVEGDKMQEREGERRKRERERGGERERERKKCLSIPLCAGVRTI
jgi:hypothetical protein